VVSLVITTLFSLDILVVKHYFSAEIAGAYAGISTIARIIFFLTASVAAVLLSSVKLEAAAATNRRLLYKSCLLQGVLGGSVLLVFAVLPHQVIQLLIGSRYLVYANLLPGLSLAIFLFAAMNLIFAYDLALRRWSVAVVALVGAVCTWIALAYHHATPAAVIQSLLIGAGALIALRTADALRRALANRS